MTDPRFRDPDPTERFYARALAALTPPPPRASRMTALLHGVNLTYWLGVLTALAWLGAQAVYRPLPIIDREQVLVAPGVRAGEPVKVSYTFRRLEVCSTDVTWQETDGAREIHRFGPVHIPSPGERRREDFVYSWATAHNAVPGPSRLRIVLEYQCPGNYLEAFWPLVEVLPEIDYDTLPGAVQAAAPGPP